MTKTLRVLAGVGTVSAIVIAASGAGHASDVLPRPDTTDVVVLYKSAYCGCCTMWARHLEDNGFQVTVREVENLAPIKERHGVVPALQSCHTAVVGGYVVEGHVPADLVRRLLDERPDVVGLTVPGMPIGSPGMEGGDAEPYDVLTFDDAGATTVFASR